MRADDLQATHNIGNYVLWYIYGEQWSAQIQADKQKRRPTLGRTKTVHRDDDRCFCCRNVTDPIEERMARAMRGDSPGDGYTRIGDGGFVKSTQNGGIE